MSKYLAPFLWVLIFQSVSILLGLQMSSEINSWYIGLHKSPLTPPNVVFPIVWTILYTLIALVGYTLWSNIRLPGVKTLFILFIIQIFLNWLWSPLFFNFHLIFVSLIFIMILIVITFTLIYRMWHSFPYSALMLIPYFLWLWFAAYLNYFIWLHN